MRDPTQRAAAPARRWPRAPRGESARPIARRPSSRAASASWSEGRQPDRVGGQGGPVGRRCAGRIGQGYDRGTSRPGAAQRKVAPGAGGSAGGRPRPTDPRSPPGARSMQHPDRSVLCRAGRSSTTVSPRPADPAVPVLGRGHGPAGRGGAGSRSLRRRVAPCRSGYPPIAAAGPEFVDNPDRRQRAGSIRSRRCRAERDRAAHAPSHDLHDLLRVGRRIAGLDRGHEAAGDMVLHAAAGSRHPPRPAARRSAGGCRCSTRRARPSARCPAPGPPCAPAGAGPGRGPCRSPAGHRGRVGVGWIVLVRHGSSPCARAVVDAGDVAAPRQA